MSTVREARRLNPAQRAAFVSAFVGWFFDYYEIFLLTFLVIPIAKEFKLADVQVAALFSLDLLFLAIGGILFGILADRFGRKNILTWTIVIYGLATLARAVSPSYGWLLAWTAIAGIGLGGEFGVGQSLISELVHEKARGFWSALLYSGAFFAIMVAALVGGHLLPLIGWRWTFAISALPLVFALYVRVASPESAIWQKTIAAEPTNWGILFTRGFAGTFLKCLIPATVYFFAYYGIASFLPTFLVAHGFSLSKASWWIFFSGFAGLLGNISGAFSSDVLGRRVTLFYLMIISALSGLALFIWWRSLLTSPWIIVPFFLLFFGSNGATVFGALFSEVFPTRIRTTGVSASLQIARGLSFFPPLLAAFLLQHSGFGAVVILGAAEYLIVALWSFLFQETKGITIAEVDQRWA